MPLAKISAPAHLPETKLRALADAVQDGLVESCGIPREDRFQLLSRFAPEAMIIDPHFPAAQRTPEASIIEILLIGPRSDAQKAQLFRRIVEGAVAAGFAGDDIMIALVENARGDWSAAGGLSYADIAKS